MRFVFNEKQYRISFQYASFRPAVKAENKPRGFVWAGRALGNIHGQHIRTFCSIDQKTNFGGKDEWVSIAGDFSVRIPEDPFIKKYGRLVALQRTLYQIKDRKLRSAVGQAYHQRGENKVLIFDQTIENNTTQVNTGNGFLRLETETCV